MTNRRSSRSVHSQERDDADDISRKIVEFDGVRIFATRRGTKHDLPTIILEAGGGGTSAWWAWVQERLARRTLVVSYDRAGLGASDTEADDMGAVAVASRLEAFLDAASIPGPYIFVGHSLGALFAQHYATTHARDTAGLVLVDPTPSDPALFGERNKKLLAFLIFLIRVSRLLAQLGMLRFYNPASRLVADLPPCDGQDARMAALNPRHLRGFIRELQAIVPIQKLVSASSFPREIPILVASAGLRSRLAAKKSKVSRNEEDGAADPIILHRLEVAGKSNHGRHLTVAGATHGSIVTRKEYAYELADHILDFAEECRSAYLRRLEEPKRS